MHYALLFNINYSDMLKNEFCMIYLPNSYLSRKLLALNAIVLNFIAWHLRNYFNFLSRALKGIKDKSLPGHFNTQCDTTVILKLLLLRCKAGMVWWKKEDQKS